MAIMVPGEWLLFTVNVTKTYGVCTCLCSYITCPPCSPVGPSCAFPSNDSSCVAEEWHILPLATTPGFFAVFRTTQGYLGASHTSDPSGRTGWMPSYYAQFGTPAPTGTGGKGARSVEAGNDVLNHAGALKNPRG